MTVRAGQEFRLRVPVIPVAPVDIADSTAADQMSNNPTTHNQLYLLQWDLCLLDDATRTKASAVAAGGGAKGMTIGFSIMLQRPDGLLPQIYSYRYATMMSAYILLFTFHI